jgi:hypothetical protein
VEIIMRATITLLTTLTAAFALGGCFGGYSSFYKQTNHQLDVAPTGPEQVKVVRSRADLTRTWTELGEYRGKAPTVQEAMDSAKLECGRNGADFYILNTDPFQSGGGWKVDGVCAVDG